MKKIKKLGDLKKIVSKLKRSGKITVFTNGCFDILHYGHVEYLKKAKKLGDVLIIGLNSDSSVRKIKGKKRPVVGESQRAAVLSALEAVDFVTIFGEKTPERLIKAITPGVLVKGGDWKKENIAGADYVKRTGGSVITIPFVKGYSTTGLLKRIRRFA
ncbi:MAG: D-glycero-beta-D-manno-heptose 1-phosphate adenylyltransferase [Candidatus Omnitrophica bacterium]|nr:D-glycero-beta-D-manno-heptose 1-phosphate adenylyltransferase [Candidatus Omnitrophota bacterium]